MGMRGGGDPGSPLGPEGVAPDAAVAVVVGVTEAGVHRLAVGGSASLKTPAEDMILAWCEDAFDTHLNIFQASTQIKLRPMGTLSICK